MIWWARTKTKEAARLKMMIEIWAVVGESKRNE